MTNKDEIKTIASEFKGDEKKLLEKLADEKMLEFTPREEFKAKLDAKIQDKIRTTKEQKADQAAMDAVPRKLKWRFYLTGYGYAIVSFVALFLIGFCTNIFTGKLDVPTKYTYLQESEAFGDLKNSQLAYNYDVDRASNFMYDANMDDFDYEDEIIETEESADYYTNSLNPFLKTAETKTLGATISAIEKSDLGDDNIYSPDYLRNSNRNFMFNQTYRFAYKDKLFPRLATEYPIYKASGVLMGSNTPNQVLKNLKIGDVSFKKFQDLEIAGLYIQQNTENGYSISFDKDSQMLNFYPNDSRQAQQFNGKLPSNKQLIKSIEKDLKQLGVSIKNYRDAEINMENYDESMGIINVFYPFEINGKEVRDAEMEEKIGMQVAYDLNLQKVVSVIGIDIATYDVSNYPILDKSYIEKEIEKGGEYFNQGALHENSTVVLFDNMEIVYIPKYENGITYYVPAIKGKVGTSLENYKGPEYVFQEITQ